VENKLPTSASSRPFPFPRRKQQSTECGRWEGRGLRQGCHLSERDLLVPLKTQLESSFVSIKRQNSLAKRWWK